MHCLTQTLTAKSQPVIKLHACTRAWLVGPSSLQHHLSSLARGVIQGIHSDSSGGPPPSSSSSFLFPSACNWKCIYCRARGWTGEREVLQLMKMWLRWGLQGLAPLQHHQLTYAVIFFSVFLFLGCSLCLQLPHTLLPSNSPLILCVCLSFISVFFLLIFALLSLLSFVSFYGWWLGVYKVHFKCKRPLELIQILCCQKKFVQREGLSILKPVVFLFVFCFLSQASIKNCPSKNTWTLLISKNLILWHLKDCCMYFIKCYFC